MPYKLVKIYKEKKLLGYKVGKKDGSKMSNGRKYASNKPLSKEKALAQMKAMIINSH